MGRTSNIRCPRCGYELHGALASWSGTCPLAGACPECGLDFEWAEIVSPTRRCPGWCVEYVLRWWQVPWASVRTWLMVLRPWRFWAELRMTHGPRWGRVAAMFALVVVALYAGFALTVGAMVLREANRRSAPVPQAVFSAAYAALLPCSSRPLGPYVPGLAPPMRYTARFLPERFPLEIGFVILTDGAAHYRGSSTLLALLVSGIAGTTVLTAPLGFIALPVSRRRAKVMWWHVGRITVYSLPVLVVALAAVFVRFTLGRTDVDVMSPPSFARIWSATLWSVATMLVAWWYFAVKRYLRMPHAFGVAVSLVAIGLLLGPALLVVLSAFVM